MGILDGINRSAALSRKQEEALYELVAEELEAGHKEKGLWLKALANSDGDEGKSMAAYVKMRVQSLADDNELLRQAMKRAGMEQPPERRPPAPERKAHSESNNGRSGAVAFLLVVMLLPLLVIWSGG